MSTLFTILDSDKALDPHFETVVNLAADHPGKQMIDIVYDSITEPEREFVQQFQEHHFDARLFELYLHAMLRSEQYTILRTKSLVKWARGILPWAQPDKRLEQQEEAERLQRQMQETLGDDWYRVMELTMMGYNSVQMGEALGISSSAARTRLMNARMLMEDAEQRYRAERP